MGLKFLVEDIHEGLDFLIEEKNRQGEQKLYITGPFLMAEEKNQNGRIYQLDEMTREVERYTNDMVKSRRAIGEMNHPQSTEVNPVNACHLVTELKQNGNYFMGKSQVLNTPMGLLLKSLIQDNIKMGISSRALGNVNETSTAKHVSNFHLICLDVVHQPSVQNAMLESVMESKEWMIRPDGTIVEAAVKAYKQLEERLSRMPKHETDSFIKESLLSFIKMLKAV
jgi:Prohead core protein serine protease